MLIQTIGGAKQAWTFDNISEAINHGYQLVQNGWTKLKIVSINNRSFTLLASKEIRYTCDVNVRRI